MPVRRWISRLVPSQYADGTVYVTQRGREDDDFGAYVWKSHRLRPDVHEHRRTTSRPGR